MEAAPPATVRVIHRAWPALTLVLLLASCSACSRKSPEARYKTAEEFFEREQLKEALADVDPGLRGPSSVSDSSGIWKLRLLKTRILLANGNAGDALRSLGASGPPPDPELGSWYFIHRGYAKVLQSDYGGAEKDFDQAGELAHGSPRLDAEIGVRRGFNLVRQGRSDEAESVLRQTLAIANSLQDPALEAASMGNLGVLFAGTYHYDQAIFWYEKALAIFERLRKPSSVAKTLGNLGWAYYSLGENDRALALFGTAEAHFRATGDKDEQQIWMGNGGVVLQAEGDRRGAVERFKGALAISQKLHEQYWASTWLNNLADTLIDTNDFDIAERYNQEALREKHDLQDDSEIYPRVNEARIAAGRNNFALAERLYQAILDGPFKDPAALLEAQSGLADLLSRMGQFDRAEAQFRSAIVRIEGRQAILTEDEHKLSYLSSLIDFYRDYVDFLVTRNQPERALEVVESSRARVLDERFRLTNRRRPIASAAQFEQLARASNGVLLSYWLAPKRSFLWVVTPRAIELHELPPQSRIDPLVGGYRAFIESLRDPLQSAFPDAAKLAQVLLNPAREHLADGAHVIVVPDGSLYSLNFETLLDPANPSRYLIEAATLAIAPSLGMLMEGPSRAGAPHRELLIGDPKPEVDEYPRLPHAAEEIDEIARDFPAAGRTILEGAEASPASYRAAAPGGFDLIHFAAHARADREAPLNSALILSRSGPSYQLSARDVMNLPISAALVTLSACQSAGARTYSGEGLVGLSWAFLHAGARSVVAGLWDVTDLSTAALMKSFYARLAHGAGAASALRSAKLELVHATNAWNKPFYWAPFQLYTGTVRP